MLEDIANSINILGDFCGKRDIAELTPEQLLKKYKIPQADVMVLFGGSIMCGGDVLAQAMKNHIAWDINRYISLLMGEIPRLSDDENGYGPKGKNFIAHVDTPLEVRNAFNELYNEYSELVREANPLYASGE